MGSHRRLTDAPGDHAVAGPARRLALLASLALMALALGGGGAAAAPTGPHAAAPQQHGSAPQADRGPQAGAAKRCKRGKRGRQCRQVKRCRRLKGAKRVKRCLRRTRRRQRTTETAGGLQAGVYRGLVGTFARIVFTVTADGKVVTELNAGVKTNCQRASDGYLTETKVVSTAPAEQRPPASLRIDGGRFDGRGQDANGVGWSVEGTIGTDGKARGRFEASLFESLFNPYAYGGFDGQLCAGSGDWTARLSDG